MPKWLERSIIITIVGLILGGIGAWALNISPATAALDKRVTAIEIHKGDDHDRLVRIETKVDNMDAYLREKPKVVVRYIPAPKPQEKEPSKTDVLNGLSAKP